MSTQTFNFRALVGAVAALALTMVLSWTFVDATRMARVQRDGAHGVMDSVAAMIR